MIRALDSATPPDQAAAQAARAAGVGGWWGYLATRPGMNLLNIWSQAEFDTVRSVFGSQPVGFCSGWDDPLAVRALADLWGVRPCLDVEAGIRPDGLWVQPWLDASGAGLYGNLGVHSGRTAPFHILSDYPGLDPGDVWLPATGWPRPAGPLGWQWQGSHQEFGLDVDGGWYDDWFAGMTPEQAAQLQQVFDQLAHFGAQGSPNALDFIVSAYQVLSLGQSGLTPNPWLAQQLAELQTAVSELQAAVKALTPGPVAAHTHPLSGSTGAPQ